jgi:hypothetical protein
MLEPMRVSRRAVLTAGGAFALALGSGVRPGAPAPARPMVVVYRDPT